MVSGMKTRRNKKKKDKQKKKGKKKGDIKVKNKRNKCCQDEQGYLL